MVDDTKKEDKIIASIELKQEQFNDVVDRYFSDLVYKKFEENRSRIEKAIDDFFSGKRWDGTDSLFANSFDWAVENAFRKALDKALKDCNYEEVVYKKIIDLLKDEKLLTSIAMHKINSAFGIPHKTESTEAADSNGSAEIPDKQRFL